MLSVCIPLLTASKTIVSFVKKVLDCESSIELVLPFRSDNPNVKEMAMALERHEKRIHVVACEDPEAILSTASLTARFEYVMFADSTANWEGSISSALGSNDCENADIVIFQTTASDGCDSDVSADHDEWSDKAKIAIDMFGNRECAWNKAYKKELLAGIDLRTCDIENLYSDLFVELVAFPQAKTAVYCDKVRCSFDKQTPARLNEISSEQEGNQLIRTVNTLDSVFSRWEKAGVAEDNRLATLAAMVSYLRRAIDLNHECFHAVAARFKSFIQKWFVKGDLKKLPHEQKLLYTTLLKLADEDDLLSNRAALKMGRYSAYLFIKSVIHRDVRQPRIAKAEPAIESEKA